MSLTIALQNTSDTDQTITLFDSGGVGTASFITTNSQFTGQSQVTTAPSGSPTTQQLNLDGTIYYDAVFNPSTGYYFGSVGTTIGFNSTINGSSYSYLTVIPSVANRTFDDIQTFLTNILRNDGTNPRPNAQVILNVTQNNGVNYLSGFVVDIIQSNESVVYNSMVLYYDATAIGVGGASTLSNYDQIFSTQPPDPNIYILGTPNTQSADSDGWFTFQGNNLTLVGTTSVFSVASLYLGVATFTSSQAYQFEFQLTEALPTGDFQLQEYGTFSTLVTINGSLTSVQTFSGIVTNATGLNSLRVRNTSATSAWNGQLRMRVSPMTGSQSPKGSISISLLSQLNQAGAYLSSNPNIVGKVSSNGVGLQEILNSTTGNTYKVTSMYIWSINPVQLTQSITYGVKNANGNIEQTELDIVIDPFAQNSVTYRTNGMDGFEIDSNSFLQFVLKAKSAVNMKLEYEKNGSDEIKLIEMGLGMLLSKEYEEKAKLDAQLADDFDTFYLKQ